VGGGTIAKTKRGREGERRLAEEKKGPTDGEKRKQGTVKNDQRRKNAKKKKIESKIIQTGKTPSPADLPG